MGPRRSTPHHKPGNIRGVPAVIPSSNNYRPVASLYLLETKCEVCYEKKAKYICPICGRHVCEDHYIIKHSRCVICFEAACSICGHRPSVGRCSLCSRLVCHSDSVDIDGIRRICYACIMSSRVFERRT